MKIGIIGTGHMGFTLGKLWAEKGHQVFLGSRETNKGKEKAASIGNNAQGGSYAQATEFGEAVLLATPWDATEEIVKSAGSLSDKLLIDCTNPVSHTGNSPLDRGTSAAEEVAKWAPGAKVIKAFNSIHFANLTKPKMNGQTLTAFYCGDDNRSKDIVARLIKDIGFEPVDSGPLKNARLLEPLALLWIYLAFQGGMRPDTAFKLLKEQK